MKNKIKKRDVVKIQYYIYCPICNYEIIGNSSEQVNYNLEVHIKQKHKNERR